MSKITEKNKQQSATVTLAASASLPSQFGEFTIYGFLDPRTGKEHTAIVRGEISGKSDVPCRVHSECHTGDVLGSLRCDCRMQLETALKYIGKQEYGLVLYLKQEGRDIGLINKIKAYKLQDQGLDTVEANLALGLPEDGRTYDIAADMLRILEVESIKLLSNNPEKFKGLEDEGITITGRIPIVIESNRHSNFYLKTKEAKMGHVFAPSSEVLTGLL